MSYLDREVRKQPNKGQQGNLLPVIKKNTESFFDLAKERKCGDCTACCTVMIVHEVPTAGYCDCKHQRKAGTKRGRRIKAGCAVYEDRPPSCKTYTCYWRQGMFENRDRPDRSGVIVDTSEGVLIGVERLIGRPVVVVREARIGAHREGRFKLLVSSLVARSVVIYHGYRDAVQTDYPPIMAPNAVWLGEANAAIAKLDAWAILSDEHREGQHSTAAPECPTCEGKCPAHHEDGFYPGCLVCMDIVTQTLEKAQQKA